MKHFIVLIRHVAPLSEVEAATERHREFLQQLYDQGLLLISGPLVPRTGGVLWMKSESLEAAETRLAEDPFRREGISTHEILEFNPVKHAEIFDASIFT